MKVFRLNASHWHTPEDFYSALLPALEAPAWHGHNLDALEESLRDGDINVVQPPFHVEVTDGRDLPADMKDFLARVATIFDDVRNDGVKVSFELR